MANITIQYTKGQQDRLAGNHTNPYAGGSSSARDWHLGYHSVAKETDKYDIRINEAQRQNLITALTQCKEQNYFGDVGQDQEEIEMLLDMLDKDVDPLVDPEGQYSANVLNDFTA